MRKHFLILMLLALLPLAGWAADFATATVSINDVPYGRHVTTDDITLKINGNKITGIQWDGKYYKAYDAATRTFSQLVELEEGEFPTYGTYYIKITPANTGENNGFAMGEVLIRKRLLTIDFEAVEKAFQYEKTRATTEKDASYIKYTIKDVDASTEQAPVTYEPFAAAAEDANNDAVAAAAAKAAAGQAFVEEIGLKVGRVGADTQFDAKSYDFTFEISEDASYTLSKATNDNDKFVIAPKNITSITDPDAENKAFTLNAAASYTYNGEDRVPTFTVIDGLGNDITSSIQVYWFKDNAPSLEESSVTSLDDAVIPNGAGTYYAMLVGKDNTNYTGKKIDNTNWKFTIKKAEVVLSILPMESVYDGQPISLAKAKIDYQGLFTADARGILDNFGNKLSVVFSENSLNTNAPTDVLWTTAATPAVDPNGYKLSIKLVNGFQNTSLFKNYQIMFKGEQDETATLHDIDNTSIASVTGYYKITQRPITIAPKTIEMEYGSAKPTVPADGAAAFDVLNEDGEVTTAGNLDITKGSMVEGESFLAAIKFAANANASGSGNSAVTWPNAVAGQTYPNTITLSWAATATAGEGQTLTQAQTASNTALTVAKNYKVTLNKGAVLVVGKGLTVYVNNNAVEYGDDLSDFDFGYTAGGKTLAETPKYQVYRPTDLEKPITDLENLPIGTYVVKMVQSDKLSPANYSIKEYRNGYLFVEPKEITVTINPLTLNPGTTVATLNDYASVDESYKENLVGDDKETGLTFTFAFNAAAEKTGTTTNETLNAQLAFDTENNNAVTGLKADATAADYLKGIIATVIAKDVNDEDNGWIAANDNYNVTFVEGALKIVNGGVLYLTQADKYLADKIQAAATACAAAPAENEQPTTYTVTFGPRTLKEGNWYTMVLPFDVKTTELVANLKAKDVVEEGQTQTYHEVYAIVNTLSANSTANHISYTLEMNKVAANVPFLIKVAEDVDLQDVTFTTKKILNGATTVGNGENYGGNKFVGVYTATSIKSDGTNVYGFLGDPDFTEGMKNEWYEPANNAWNVKPLEAYLIYSPNKTVASPLITVEDFGGQTTAISEVKAGEFQEVKTDGWYTIDGIKLQGAPTEKGIYINNGKKIVVK